MRTPASIGHVEDSTRLDDIENMIGLIRESISLIQQRISDLEEIVSQIARSLAGNEEDDTQ